MRLIWYDGTLQEVKDNRFYQSFRDYILIPYDEDRKNNLDELEDEILDEQDELLEERGQPYTKETEEYLKKTSKKTLDKLMNSSLKELITDIPLRGLRDDMILEEFPDDYKLKDVRNIPKTEQLITPFKEKGAIEKEYTVANLEKRIRDSITSKNDLADFITYDNDSPKNKIILKFNMPSETPEEKNGKIGWYESLGIEVALHKPKKPETGLKRNSSIVEISDDIKALAVLKEQGSSGADFEKTLIDTLFENRDDFERIILSNIPDTILDSKTLYDFTMTLTINFKEIPEDKLYAKDTRRTLEYSREKGRNEEGEMEYEIERKDNPNYGEFLLDDNGEREPLYDGDVIENLVQIKTEFRNIRTNILKPRTTMAATSGETERVRGLGRAGMTAGRAGTFDADKINAARKYYLNLLKARLEKLEEAMSKIPVAKEA